MLRGIQWDKSKHIPLTEDSALWGSIHFPSGVKVSPITSYNLAFAPINPFGEIHGGAFFVTESFPYCLVNED